MSVKIITDSTSYIPRDLIVKYDISIVSLNIVFGDESFREVEIDNTTFYDKLSKSKVVPTSSQPSINEMYEAFERCIIQNNSVVGIFLSSDMSGTYSTAFLVKDMVLQKYPQAVIEIIDSRSNCMQMGFSVLSAARIAIEGGSIQNVLEAANDVIKRSRFLFFPETLEYLKKGGRIGNASALLGTIFQIKPILTVEHGKTSIFEKVRTSKKAITRIVDTLTVEINKKGLGGIIVHHINSGLEGKKLAIDLEEILGVPVDICSIGPVIGLHVGPGAIGVVYYTKE